jgi:hypothetical protein
MNRSQVAYPIPLQQGVRKESYNQKTKKLGNRENGRHTYLLEPVTITNNWLELAAHGGRPIARISDPNKRNQQLLYDTLDERFNQLRVIYRVAL